MMKKDSFPKGVMNFFFSIAIVICCAGMIYALVIFVYNCNYLRLSMDRMIDNLIAKPDSFENWLNYEMKLQEIEANSISTNILTFLYTFLSGSLIGVATYFTKKSYDSIKQIQENKELLINLDSRTLFSNLYVYAQKTYFTMQVFSVSLDAIQDPAALSEFIDRYIPQLNEFINEMLLSFINGKNKIKSLSNEDKACLLKEINGIGNLVNKLRIPQPGNPLITNNSDDSIQTMWKEQLGNIRRILRDI